MADPINDEALEPIENPSDPVITGNLIINSKFRRETSNFKINFDMSSVDLTSEDQGPVLIKYIEKNLKPEELLGVVATIETPKGGVTADVMFVQKVVGEGVPDIYRMAIGIGNENPTLYYVPSTGALSLNDVYEEEEEGGETEPRVIDLTKLEYDSSAKTYSGYETNLSADDFVGAKFTIGGNTRVVTQAANISDETGRGYTIALRLSGDEGNMAYNPTTGQFRVFAVADN